MSTESISNENAKPISNEQIMDFEDLVGVALDENPQILEDINKDAAKVGQIEHENEVNPADVSKAQSNMIRYDGMKKNNKDKIGITLDDLYNNEISNNEQSHQIQCDKCKIWLEKEEHPKHLKMCCDESPRTPNDPTTSDNGSNSLSEDETDFSFRNKDVNKPPAKKSGRHPPNICTICKMSFRLKRNLEKHMRHNHPEEFIVEEFQCTHCPYKTSRKDNLRRHQITHKDIKPFECHVCGLKFRGNAYLKIHVKAKHTDGLGKDCQCPHCSYKTDRNDSLKKHIKRLHSACQPVQCIICMAEFNIKFDLKEHVKEAHMSKTGKNFKCEQCPFETNYKHRLQDHLKSHESN